MATSPTAMPDQQAGAPPQGGAPASQPPQGGPQDQGGATSQPANQMQMLLAKWSQAAREMAQSDPRIASAMNKVSQAIQEAQTALVTPPQPTPTSQQPMY